MTGPGTVPAPGSRPLRVVLADDSGIFREGLRLLLDRLGPASGRAPSRLR